MCAKSCAKSLIFISRKSQMTRLHLIRLMLVFYLALIFISFKKSDNKASLD